MVRVAGFVAINQENNDDRRDEAQETLEAQEARVIDEYESALRGILDNDLERAEVTLKTLLKDELLLRGATEQLQHLKYLALKNLAEVLAQQPERAIESLEYYECASKEEEYIQVSVLDRYGTLAAKKGEWSLARKVFELALSKDPHHPTLQHKLLQLLLHVGDIAAAKNLSNDFIHVNPYNKLAERILQGGEDRSETGACLFNLPPCHPPPLQPVTPRIFVDPPLEIVVETGTWAELLEKCAMLLQTSKTAFADVLFRFPATASDPEFPSSDAREEDQSEPVNGEAVLQAPNGTLKTGCIDLMEGAPENDSSKDEGKSNQMEDEEQDATSRRMTRSKRAQIAEAPLSGNQPDMEEDLQPESPSLLHLLKEYISSPSEEYASIFEMTESQDIKQTAVNDEGTNGSILHQRTKVKEHAVVMSQKMCVTEASIHILKSLLQPDALHGLLDAKFALLEVVVLLCRTHNNGRSRLSSCLSHHEILIISELFVDAAYQTRIARVGLSGKQSSKQPDGLKFNDLLDMATFWLFQYQLYEYDENEKSSLDISYQIRFWWAQGRYFEAKNVPTEALRAYQICLGQLEESGMSDVLVNHNVTDKTVNRREILEKLQVVQLYDVFEHANAAAQKFAWLEVKSILSPVLFSGDQKEAYMAAVDPNVWREALGVLLNASKGLGDCVLAFRCYLRLLHHRLPPLPTNYKRLFGNEEERNTVTIEHNLAIPECDINVQAMEKFVDAWADPWLAEALDFLKSELANERINEYIEDNRKTLEEYLFQSSVQKAISFLQLCSGSINSSWRDGGAAASRKDEALDVPCKLQRMLNDVAVTALCFWRFDQGKQKPMAEALVDWCYKLCETLGNLGALMEHGGRFVSLAFLSLCDARRIVESPEKDNSAGSGTDDDDCEMSIINGFNHCVFWLYGLRIPTIPSEPWGGKQGSDIIKEAPSIRNRLSTQAQVYQLWPFVESFLEEETSKDKLKQHDLFLKHVFSLFPSMPDPLEVAVKESWVELGSNNSPQVGASSGCKDPFDGLVARALPVDEQAANEDLQHQLSVMGSIFSFQARMVPELGETLKDAFPDKGILDPRSDEMLDRVFAPCLRALALAQHVQPPFLSIDKCGAWAELALLYHEAADLLLGNGAAALPSREWRHRHDLRNRVAKYRRYANWCTCIAELHVEDDDSETLLELLSLQGLKTYEEVTNGPPEYNQIWSHPEKDDARLADHASSALRIYNRASELDPGEWSFHKQAARSARWLRLPVETWLRRLALACHCALQREGVMLDPIYTLHAARLKLAQGINISETLSNDSQDCSDTVELLWLLARYCFRSENRERIAKTLDNIDVSSPQPTPSDRDQLQVPLEFVKDMLVKDGVAAMEWCLEKQKYFHRASTALAKANKNNPDEVIRHLEPLFSKSKGSFALNMYPITEPITGKKKKSRQQRRHSGDAKKDGKSDKNSLGQSGEAAEADWGLCPEGKLIAGIGMDESSVAFSGHMRKALSMYLRALLAAQRIETLSAASKYLSTSAEYSAPGFDDVRMVAKGYYILGVLSSSIALCPLDSLVQAFALMSKMRDYKNMDDIVASMVDLKKIVREVAVKGKPAEDSLARTFQLYLDNAILPCPDKNEANISEVARKMWKRTIVEPANAVLSISNAMDGASTAIMPAEQPIRDLFRIQNSYSDVSATRDCFQMYSLLYVYLLGTSKALEALRREVQKLKQRWAMFSKVEKSIPINFLTLAEALYISAYVGLIERYGDLFEQVSQAKPKGRTCLQVRESPTSQAQELSPAVQDAAQRISQQTLHEDMLRRYSMHVAAQQSVQALRAASLQQRVMQIAMQQRLQALQAASSQNQIMQNSMHPFLSRFFSSSNRPWAIDNATSSANPLMTMLGHLQQPFLNQHRTQQTVQGTSHSSDPQETEMASSHTQVPTAAPVAPASTSTPAESPSHQDSASAMQNHLKTRTQSAHKEVMGMLRAFGWLQSIDRIAPFSQTIRTITTGIEDFLLKCLNCYYDLNDVAVEERPSDREESLKKCEQLMKEWNETVSRKRSGTGNADSEGGKKRKQLQTHLTDFINT